MPRSRPQCQALTNDGKACQNTSMKDSAVCYTHRNVRPESPSLLEVLESPPASMRRLDLEKLWSRMADFVDDDLTEPSLIPLLAAQMVRVHQALAVDEVPPTPVDVVDRAVSQLSEASW